MADKQKKTRREYLTVEAIDPSSGMPYDVLISYDRIRAVGRRSFGQAKECAYTVPMILQKPTAVFEGLRRDTDEEIASMSTSGWRCYCGIPETAYNADGKSVPAWPGEVFLVYVNHDSVAYNWRWEKCDPDEPGLPADHSVGEDEAGTRFRRR